MSNKLADASISAKHDPGGRRKPRWPAGSVVTARFSDCGRYRYALAEVWDASRPMVAFLLMNPSVAGLDNADPTLIRTGGFARAWGYGGQAVANVHAYRATESARWMEVADPAGPENGAAILATAGRAVLTVLAYGKPPKPLRARADHVVKLLKKHGHRLAYLRLAKDGTPCHPLYLPAGLTPTPYTPA